MVTHMLVTREEVPLKPAISRESTHNSQCRSDDMTVMKTSQVRTCGPRASVAMFGLALSVGASGAILTSPGEAFAANSTALSTLPSKASGQPLGSVGSSHLSPAALAYHTVVEGETLWDIAADHGVDVAVIKQANGLAEDAVIKSGQVLKIPADNTGGPAASQSAPVALSAPDEAIKTISNASSASRVAVVAPVDQSGPAASLNATIAPSMALPDNGSDDLVTAPNSAADLSTVSVDGTVLPTSGDTLVAVERSSLPSLTVAPTVSVGTTHEVQLGDSLWSIARDYQVSPEVLASANGIRNPERIFVGRSLVIPANSVEQAEETVEAPAFTTVELATTQEITLDLPQESDSRSLVSVHPDEGVEAVAPAAEAVDPYVASLLTEVRAAQGSHEAAEATTISPAAPLEIASGSTTVDYSGDLEASLPVNPQFTSPDSTQSDGIDEQVGNHLLAAAPLGSEVYAPITEDPTGRVVSPGMPILPDASEYLPEAPSHFSGYVWPAQGVFTSGYGWRWGRMHQGIDIAGPVGTPIYAAAPGVVQRSGWNSGGYGNLVEVRHPDGSMTRYAHNSRLLVESGQQVRQGQQIAEMGSTGYSTGPHLHFEIHLPNQGPVNPMAHLPGE
jgi:murein DD-endopeptidase MepM/ murein hydrolase activator NlpD